MPSAPSLVSDNALIFHLGDGLWPSYDVHGRPLDPINSTAEQREKAGTPICGPFRGCFDGLQGDQDYLAKLLNLQSDLKQVDTQMSLTQDPTATTRCAICARRDCRPKI